MKKSGTKTPHIELEEIGPSADLVLRRSKLASSDLFKTACRTPAQAKVTKTQFSKEWKWNYYSLPPLLWKLYKRWKWNHFLVSNGSSSFF